MAWVVLLCCAASNSSATTEADDPTLYRVVRVEKDDVLNVRKAPDPKAQIQGAIPPDGEGIIDLGGRMQVGSYEWYRIRYGKVRGWVNSLYLERDPALFRVTGVASDDVLNVRERPQAKAAIVGGIPPTGVGIVWQGEKEVVGANYWLKIRYKGIIGWVNSKFLERQ